MTRFVAILAFLFTYATGNSQLHCPDDVVTSCFTSLSVEELGNANVVSGNYHQSHVKYIDTEQTDACNVGVVLRKFYIDTNGDNIPGQFEPTCTQTITLEYDGSPFNVQFPSDVTLSCLDEVQESSPSWIGGPCDLIGYTYEDEVFDFEGGACRKILRHFSVINWCLYDSGTGDGLVTGTQIIKIIDEEAPEIESCQSLEFGAVENCETTITLTNSASEMGDCPSGTLTWSLSVDLWADGTEDLKYGKNEPGIFKLDPIGNGEEISVTLPEQVGIAMHKYAWTVTDGCGNVRTCYNTFEVIDNKPPTPYCYGFLSAALNGAHEGTLEVPASLFDRGAWDNCSSGENIEISFSDNVDDKIRIYECGEVGFQFLRVYATDEAGNQSYCEVFLFVLDNGSCSSSLAMRGTVMTPSGFPIIDTDAALIDGPDMITSSQSDDQGEFSFGEQALMDTYQATVSKTDDPMEGIDIEDYQMLVQGLVGYAPLNAYQDLAADLNDDGRVNIDDLKMLKSVLQGNSVLTDDQPWRFVKAQELENGQLMETDPYFDLVDYQGSFNFIGVKKGDLSSSSMTATIVEEQPLEMTFTITNDGIEITNNTAIQSSILALDFGVNAGQVSGNSMLSKVETGTGTRVSNLDHATQWGEQELNININQKSTATAEELLNSTIKSMDLMSWNAEQKTTIKWDIIDLRDNVSDEEVVDQVTAMPTIFTDQVQVTSTATIQSVSLLNINGQPVPSNINLNDKVATVSVDQSAPIGIYFMVIKTADKETILKVIKG